MTDRSAQSKLPPPMAMMQLLFGKQLTYSLSGVARLGVADHMDGTARPVEEIAAKCGAHAPSLYRVMRMLAGFGVFEEGPSRHFALTPVGELLKTDAPGSLRYLAMMFGEEFSTRAYEHFTDMLAHRRRRRERSLWQADLGGAGRAARAMRDLPARDDQLHLGRRRCHRRGLRFFRDQAPRRCRRRSWPAARRDLAPLPQDAGRAVRPARGGGQRAARTSSPAAKGASPSRRGVSSSACPTDATPTS